MAPYWFTSKPAAVSLAVVTLVTFGQLTAATPQTSDSCPSTIVLDPQGQVRNGDDYRWIDLGKDGKLSDCVDACCGDTSCLSFSFNNVSKYCSQAGPSVQVCCALKGGIPSLQNSTYGDGVHTGHKPLPPHGLPTPSKHIQEYLDMGLTMFMHFSVTTFGNIEHDCVNGKCLPASMFNPTNMGADASGKTATDQWAATAAALGAGEICLTAHHEGGFCLWPSKHSNYTVMQSGYPHDIVKQFVASCQKYNIKPCFYIGPNANGYMTQVLKYTPQQFFDAQMGMIREVLTEYGAISRLWWDHYMAGCGGLSECPQCDDPKDPACFPAAWGNFTQLVRQVSPDTLLGTGPDVAHSGGGESGVGDYPVWNGANSTVSGGFGPYGFFFRPREADATIQNPGDAWFWKANHSYWKAADIWDHYMLTVGRGETFILNMPPDTTGRIPQEYVLEATRFGNAMSATFDKPVASVSNVNTSCSSPIVVNMTLPTVIDTFRTREDLSFGQRIANYAIDVLDGNGQWQQQPTWGQTVGNRIIDILNSTVTTSAVRFRCLSAIQDPIHIREFGVFKSQPPPRE